MDDEKYPKSTARHIVDQAKGMQSLAKLFGRFNKKLHENFKDVETRLAGVEQLMAESEIFAKTYSSLGWVHYDRLSIDLLSKVVALSVEEGEAALTDYHLDSSNLQFLGYRFHTPHYKPWLELYDRAVERINANDYLSAVPIALIIIDGICSSMTGKHPFSGGADAPVFDSQTSGPGGLAEGFSFLGSTRRKLDMSPIAIPFRHGIVHGLNPNFGKPIVAAKVFNLLQATVDYFDRRRDEADRIAKAAEEQRPPDLRDLLVNIRKNEATKKAIADWNARPAISGRLLSSSENPVNLDEGTPEAFAMEYLSLLVANNYGGLAKNTVDYPKRSIGYRAGRIRDDLKEVSIKSWEITGYEDESPAISRVLVRLTGQTDGCEWQGEETIRLMFVNDDYEAMVRGQSDGQWAVMPDFLGNLRLQTFRLSSE